MTALGRLTPPQRRFLDQVDVIREEPAAEVGSVAFLSRLLVQANLPYREPAEPSSRVFVTVKVGVGWARAGRAMRRARAARTVSDPRMPKSAARGRMEQRAMLSSRRGVCRRAGGAERARLTRSIAPRFRRSQTARQLHLEYRSLTFR